MRTYNICSSEDNLTYQFVTQGKKGVGGHNNEPLACHTFMGEKFHLPPGAP